MGYRSQVGIALSKSAVERMNQKLAIVDEEMRSAVEGLLDSPDSYKRADSGAEGFIWDSLKWYDEDPETKFFEELFREIDCTNYLFVRVGDSADDGDCTGCFYNNPFGLRLVRKVEMN